MTAFGDLVDHHLLPLCGWAWEHQLAHENARLRFIVHVCVPRRIPLIVATRPRPIGRILTAPLAATQRSHSCYSSRCWCWWLHATLNQASST
jgi:hypothetical protein